MVEIEREDRWWQSFKRRWTNILPLFASVSINYAFFPNNHPWSAMVINFKKVRRPLSNQEISLRSLVAFDLAVAINVTPSWSRTATKLLRWCVNRCAIMPIRVWYYSDLGVGQLVFEATKRKWRICCFGQNKLATAAKTASRPPD